MDLKSGLHAYLLQPDAETREILRAALDAMGVETVLLESLHCSAITARPGLACCLVVDPLHPAACGWSETGAGAGAPAMPTVFATACQGTPCCVAPGASSDDWRLDTAGMEEGFRRAVLVALACDAEARAQPSP